MRLAVAHTTSYRFDSPRLRVIQSHRLTPVSHGGQRVRDWQVTVEGAIFGARFVDGAGDVVQTMTLAGPVEGLRVEVAGTVETEDTAGVLRDHREIAAPAVYLRRTRATAPDMGLKALADRAGPGRDLDAAHRLSALVAEAIDYVPGVTGSSMTAGEVVELGQGVCQDMAQILIALARLREVPARYVTGYMLAGEDENVGAAGHAWAELYVEGLGWVGFDPANRCCPDARYIRVGSGLDAAAAAPIRGVAQGQGGERLDVSVSVARAGQSQSQSQGQQSQDQG